MTPRLGTILLVAGYVGLLVWALRRREPAESGWRDLRWWVAVLVGIQIALYLWL
jgi:hypothetical protein